MSRRKQILLISLVVIILVAILFFCTYEILHSPFSILLWCFTLFIIFGIFFSIFQIIYPIEKRKLHLPQQMMADFQDEQLDDLGIFTFHKQGFTISFEDEERTINWDSIQTIQAYKKDLYTYDLICLDIHLQEGDGFSINEETPGWFKFSQRIKEQFNEVDKGWDIDIITPAFEANHTILYSKETPNV